MKSISEINRGAYYRISTFIFLYFFTWSSSFGLYALWLSQKVGLDSVTIGSVFAINGVFAVILKPIYGYIMDKIGMSKKTTLFCNRYFGMYGSLFCLPISASVIDSYFCWDCCGGSLSKFRLVCGCSGVRVLCRSFQSTIQNGIWPNKDVGLSWLGISCIGVWHII